MSILQRFEPRRRSTDVAGTMPPTHSMGEFLEDFPPRRWMERFEPLGWRWPMGVDYERSFRLDVIDHDNELVVRGELPGIKKDDIEVTVVGDRLTIEAERQFEEEDSKESYYRHEVGHGRLMRVIALPVEVDADKVHAELNDGILTVTLPKMRVAERHTVEVA